MRVAGGLGAGLGPISLLVGAGGPTGLFEGEGGPIEASLAAGTGGVGVAGV